MGSNLNEFKEVMWPPIGFIYDQEFMLPAFCKPKLCPLKSITLEKLEKMQQESVERLKQMEEQQAEKESAAASENESTEATQAPSDAKVKTDIWKADD